ncbi:MAG TPA: bifunctional 3,4-dihydroxy-2-butanone-4-phosphate synthase/GTP cyclohydrolase II [bacterium]|nr:bifunctional 3,4-dihydroxy-2-butanone-4-phosphate synthase/GTP cyclohydrolase II [bacterium]
MAKHPDPIENVERAIADIRAGRFVILVDDEKRENEGDLCLAAEAVTPEAVNFMARYGRGLICLTLQGPDCDRLGLPMMVSQNRSPLTTAFTASIEARKGVTTGISAADRAHTIRVAIDKASGPDDVVSPGHVFPLRARDGGVLVRAGQTEGSIDLARLAGLQVAGVICEIMNDDGTMARMPQLEKFAAKHGRDAGLPGVTRRERGVPPMTIVSIADLIAYRLRRESLVHRSAEATLPTSWGGKFRAIAYETLDKQTHVALVKGKISPEKPVLVRVHSKCLTGDVFGSERCDCGPQLHAAMAHIEKEGSGVILYLDQEGRGIGLVNKLKAYVLQDKGEDTVTANEKLGFAGDLRDYGIGAQILRDLGVRKMKILTNNPKKIVGLEGYGLEVVDRVPIEIAPNEVNAAYLRTKRDKMGHLLTLVEEDTRLPRARARATVTEPRARPRAAARRARGRGQRR